jgi:hypothetical protein
VDSFSRHRRPDEAIHDTEIGPTAVSAIKAIEARCEALS